MLEEGRAEMGNGHCENDERKGGWIWPDGRHKGRLAQTHGDGLSKTLVDVIQGSDEGKACCHMKSDTKSLPASRAFAH